MEFTFKVGSKIKEVWKIYKKHFGTFLLLVIVSVAIQAINQIESIFTVLISILASFLLSYVWINFLIYLVDNKEFNFFTKEILPSIKQFLNFIVVGFLTSIIIMVGLILLIVPGLYLSGRLLFAIYFLIEEKIDPIQAIKKSWEITKNYSWRLLWKSILIGLFAAVGFLAFGVGFIITYPMAMVLLVMLYKEFVKFKNQPIVNVLPVNQAGASAMPQ